jgi:regulatory protein
MEKNYWEKILAKLQSYCAYQERSRLEVRRRMAKYELAKEAEELLLNHLEEENFLNEERFAEVYARSKFNQKSWGPRKIRQALRQHELEESIIEQALKQLPAESQEEVLQKLMLKKIRSLKSTPKAIANDFALRQKVWRHLAQKGYAPEHFEDSLRTLCQQHNL